MKKLLALILIISLTSCARDEYQTCTKGYVGFGHNNAKSFEKVQREEEKSKSLWYKLFH